MGEPISNYYESTQTNVVLEFALRTAAGGPFSGLAIAPSPPATPIGIASTTGGTLAAGNWFIAVTNTTVPGNGVSTGETTISGVLTVAVTGTTASITASINAVGLTIGGNNWYIGASITGPFFLAGSTSSPTASFVFVSAPGSGTQPPTTNTAFPHGLQITTQVDLSTEVPITLALGGTYGTYTTAGQIAESPVIPGKYSLCLTNGLFATGSKLRTDIQGVNGMQAYTVVAALNTGGPATLNNQLTVLAAIENVQIAGIITAASPTSLTVGTLTINGTSNTPLPGVLGNMMCLVLDPTTMKIKMRAQVAPGGDAGTSVRTLTFAAPNVFATAPSPGDYVAFL